MNDDRNTRITAIVLAAGRSRRFGAANKLVAQVGGLPLVTRVADALLQSRVSDIVVVTAPDASDVKKVLAACAGPRLRFTVNPSPQRGIGSSIASGVGALEATSAGAMIVPGDLPGLTTSMIDTLIAAFDTADGHAVVCAATADGQQRNPVIWPRRLFGALAALDGDTGGKALIAQDRRTRGAAVVLVPFDSARVFHDIDRAEDVSDWDAM